MPALAPSMEEDCTPHVHRSHALAPEQLQRLADRLGVTVQTLPRGLTIDSANGLLHAFISVVPKAELHIHIEGSLEPSMMLELAERNGMPAPYPSVEAAQAAYNFADLQSFLDLYYNGCAVLKTTRDFYVRSCAHSWQATTPSLTFLVAGVNMQPLRTPRALMGCWLVRSLTLTYLTLALTLTLILTLAPNLTLTLALNLFLTLTLILTLTLVLTLTLRRQCCWRCPGHQHSSSLAALRDLAWAYLRKAAANRVVHAEIFFDPQTHLANGAGFDIFMPGFLKACEDARRALGINSRLIMCFLRHLSQEDAERTLDLVCAGVWVDVGAQPYLSHIIGVGLDSSELGNPPLKFEKVMARVRELGLPVVAHAGEEGPAQYVWDTIKVLKASRVDHGVHSLDDPELMAHLASTQLPLTVCPLSNLKLKVYDGQLVQRLQELVLGPHALCITINSDDPAYFGGYMNQNYSWLAEELDLGISAVAQLARNGFLGSFISKRGPMSGHAAAAPAAYGGPPPTPGPGSWPMSGHAAAAPAAYGGPPPTPGPGSWPMSGHAAAAPAAYGGPLPTPGPGSWPMSGHAAAAPAAYGGPPPTPGPGSWPMSGHAAAAPAAYGGPPPTPGPGSWPVSGHAAAAPAAYGGPPPTPGPGSWPMSGHAAAAPAAYGGPPPTPGPGSWPMSGHAAAAPAAYGGPPPTPGPGSWPMSGHAAAAPAAYGGPPPTPGPGSWPVSGHAAAAPAAYGGPPPTPGPGSWPVSGHAAAAPAAYGGPPPTPGPGSWPGVWYPGHTASWGPAPSTWQSAWHPAAHAAGAIDPGIAQGFEEFRASEAASKAAKMKLLAALIG
ncbi:hypothetical protein QJQ45_021652 [Haematococcus lacustris]|nr:hypothetical protein QJQ45_021652 [Haematococcus lacustris]